MLDGVSGHDMTELCRHGDCQRDTAVEPPKERESKVLLISLKSCYDVKR